MDSIDRRQFIKVGLYSTAGVLIGSLFAFAETGEEIEVKSNEDLLKFDWGYIVDTTKCIGCGACVRACKIENNVPDGFYRTWVERYEITKDESIRVDSPKGAIEGFKQDNFASGEIVKAFFVPKLCNHCYHSACTQVCPVGASYESPDGVVLIDKEHCVGCGYCVQACPYGCRYIDHEKGTADKCTLCYHRIHKGEAPACVNACPRNARLFGNLKDPNSKIRKILHDRRYSVLKPDLGTEPKCYYIGLDMEVK
jgi:Fe-S-cluster-containing dehydrogenase component